MRKLTTSVLVFVFVLSFVRSERCDLELNNLIFKCKYDTLCYTAFSPYESCVKKEYKKFLSYDEMEQVILNCKSSSSVQNQMVLTLINKNLECIKLDQEEEQETLQIIFKQKEWESCVNGLKNLIELCTQYSDCNQEYQIYYSCIDGDEDMSVIEAKQIIDKCRKTITLKRLQEIIQIKLQCLDFAPNISNILGFGCIIALLVLLL